MLEECIKKIKQVSKELSFILPAAECSLGGFNSLYLLILSLTYICAIRMSKDKQWDLSATVWKDTLTSFHSEKILKKLHK